MARNETAPAGGAAKSSLIGIAIGAIAATGALTFSGHRGEATSAPNAAVVSPIPTDVALVAFTDVAVKSTIAKACRITRCRIEDLHPQIQDYADAMTREQLEAGRWAQMRLISKAIRRVEGTPPGSDARELASLELTAAARIAHLYDTRLKSMPPE